MTTVASKFLQRASRIPQHGLGLSVDVYQPDLFELVEALDRQGLACGYLEVFKAATPALAEVRRRLPSALLEYHAEGLWVTQPDFLAHYPVEAEAALAAEHLRILGSGWANVEGASKQMAGYAFGTYLPPLFTRAGAEVTAEHIAWVQARLDRDCARPDGFGPLFLLETPPLTYFGFGDFDMADFFRHVTELTPCGLVLDIGHLWTAYRYSGEWRRRSLSEFLDDFLDRFPLDRVVHLHVAGLAVHEGLASEARRPVPSEGQPWWIDAHGAPIPTVLYDVLAQVLAHPRLTQAKAIALEVDTKAITEIVTEFGHFRTRFDWWDKQAPPDPERSRPPEESAATPARSACADTRVDLMRQYEAYARVVAGLADPSSLPWSYRCLEPGAMDAYRRTYLPNEILHWGGELRDMFPETCLTLDRAGIPLDRFVDYWFREPHQAEGRYDFFLMKLERFLAFVDEVAPGLAERARGEAATLRAAYDAACDLASPCPPLAQ